MPALKAISVSQLNSYIKALFESDFNLYNLLISGEISNFKKHYPTGHFYFSLKDEKCTVKAVMFASDAKNIPFTPSNGMKVILRGSVSCYEVSGQYQIYVRDIQPEGIGSVHLAYEQLKAKLLAEGLFDDSLKKSLPLYPKKIGVITSRSGAVIHDIKTVIARRYPICEIVLCPVEVQGEKAPKQIAASLEYLNALPDIDVIIIGRGGGSAEELWAFNKEEVARAVFSSRIPVISAVGHETDVTICDFVADKRAATPSVAAEMAVPDRNNIKIVIDEYQKRLKTAVNYKFDECKNNFADLKNDVKKHSPSALIKVKKSELLKATDNLKKEFKNYLSAKNLKHAALLQRLKSCSRHSILKRGYSLIVSNDTNVKSVSEISENQEVEIVFSDGKITCKLADVKKSFEK